MSGLTYWRIARQLMLRADAQAMARTEVFLDVRGTIYEEQWAQRVAHSLAFAKWLREWLVGST